MRVLITGGSGFIGRALSSMLLKSSHEIYVYTHQSKVTDNLGFESPIRVLTAKDDFPDVDAVVSLAGASIAARMLTCKRMDELLSSRTDTIALIEEKYTLKNFPPYFIQASATGIYKKEGEADESTPPDNDEYAQLCKAIEAKAQSLSEKHQCTVALARIGVVTGNGGGICSLLRFFPRIKFIGGTNLIPYVTVEDCARALIFCIQNQLSGPVNICSDSYIGLNTLMERCCGIKSFFIPSHKVFLSLDKRGKLLLTNQRVIPQKLLENGFIFNDIQEK